MGDTDRFKISEIMQNQINPVKIVKGKILM